MFKLPSYPMLLLLLAFTACKTSHTLHTDVLVVGGGTSGTAAGIQSARMGVQTTIAEQSTWLGGMLSAAGVSAFDGNHNMPSGIWSEFRTQVYKVYGGPSKVATGWVSNTLFEPHVGDSILKQMAAKESNLNIRYRHRFIETIVKGNTVVGATFIDEASGKNIRIMAKQVIDATELGDVMASAGVPFDMGMEASTLTGENVQVPESNDIIQDMTYVAILKDYGAAADCTIVKPANYDPMEFDGCCNEFCSTPSKLTSNVDAKKMLEYGRLPNGKYMINWPGKGNDIYINMIPMNHTERLAAIEKAKAKTMRFVYFLQTQFGFKNLALASDEFPTADKLPLMPYHREGRRLQGLVRFKVQHISAPFEQSQALYRTGVSVGDYPIDHHHRENTKAPQHLGFYPVPSFNVPLGALIPAKHDGLVVAEKGISVSNVVNGTTRLQPCVMLTGQAAGATAAWAVKQKVQPRSVAVRTIQETLLQAGAYIMPYYDVKPTHPHFIAIQRTGATGILRGKGEPFQWANRTWFYPDTTINVEEIYPIVKEGLVLPAATKAPLTIEQAIAFSASLGKALNAQTSFSFSNPAAFAQEVEAAWGKWGLQQFQYTRPVTRAELAVMLHHTVDPFSALQVNHTGDFVKPNNYN